MIIQFPNKQINEQGVKQIMDNMERAALDIMNISIKFHESYMTKEQMKKLGLKK